MNEKKQNWNQLQTVTLDNFKEARRSILKQYPSHHLFNNHDKRVKEIRYCAVCGRQLTRYLVNTDRYETIVKHIKMDNPYGFSPLSVCWDVRYCGGYIRKKEKKKNK